MDIRDNNTRYKNYGAWETQIGNPYDYKNKGLIQHILSPSIANSKNKVLRIILGVYEGSIIKLLNYVDYLKNFKNYHWKNR